MELIKCTQCGGSITKGFILDMGTFNSLAKSIWVEGTLEKREPYLSQVIEDRKRHPIDAYRCDICGHLEFFAQKDSD